MARLLRIPDLGTADEEIRFLQWILEEGAGFRAGEPLAVVETTKSAIDLEPLEPGVLLRRLAREGEALARGAPYAIAGEEGEVIGEKETARLLAEPAAQVSGAPSGDQHPPGAKTAAGNAAAAAVARLGRAATARPRTPAHPQAIPAAPAARARARDLGLDLAAIPPTGPGGAVTLADVERDARTRPEAGCVDPAFLDHVRRDREAFGALDSSFKVDLYRRHGAAIGRGVVIERGAVLLAPTLRLGDEVTVREGCLVDCEVFEAGAVTHLGPRSTIRCREARLGKNVYLVRDVEIGGGGHKDPWAKLTIGSHSFLGEEVHCNVCRPIVIGEETVISRRAVVMTHAFAQSALEGYPAVFAPVTIESHAQIGIGAVIFPGVTIGRGTTVVSNSSVVTSLPEGVLASGVPAKRIRPARRTLDDGARGALARRILEDFAELLRARGRDVRPIPSAAETPGAAAWVLGGGEERSLMAYLEDPRGESLEALRRLPGGPYREVVIVRLRGELPPGLPGGETHLALLARRIRGPLGPLASSVREFLRKRGIRLEPRAWTYRGGWI